MEQAKVKALQSIAHSLQQLVRDGIPLLRVLAGKKAASLAAERERKGRVKAEPARRSEVAGDGSVSLRHLERQVFPDWDKRDFKLPYGRWAQVLLEHDDAVAFLKYLPRAYRAAYVLRDRKKKVFVKGPKNEGIKVWKNGLRTAFTQTEFCRGEPEARMWRWYSRHLGAVLKCIRGCPPFNQEFEDKGEPFQKAITFAMVGTYDQEYPAPDVELTSFFAKKEEDKKNSPYDKTDLKSRNIRIYLQDLAKTLAPCFFEELCDQEKATQKKAFALWRNAAANEYTIAHYVGRRGVLMKKYKGWKGAAKSRKWNELERIYWALSKHDLLTPEVSKARRCLLSPRA